MCTCPHAQVYAQVYAHACPLVSLEGLATLCTHSRLEAAGSEAPDGVLLISKSSAGLYFLFSCVSQVHKPHHLSSYLYCRRQPEVLKAWPHCGRATLLRLSLVPLTLFPSHSQTDSFFPTAPEGRVIRASRLRKGRACRFERWIVHVCLHRVPEIHPRQFPSPPPHPGSSATSCGRSQI